jgi:hypothetical protein
MKRKTSMPSLITTRFAAATARSFRQFTLPGADSVRGASAIEFAIVAPVIILMAIFVIDLGMGFYRKMQVESAAQAGAQYAMVHGSDTSSITTAVVSATSFSGITASPTPSQFCGCATSTGIISAACDIPCPSGSAPGTYITVFAQGTYATLLPYPGIPASFNLTAQSAVRIQ